MRKIAALASLAAVTAVLAPASPAVAKSTKRPSAKGACVTVRHGHRAKRGARRCTAHRRHARAHLALFNPHRAARLAASTSPATAHCDLVASPSGSDDHGDGSAGNPFASVVKLDSALSPGQTGCLRSGKYGDQKTEHKLSTSGTGSNRITITAYPGEHAVVLGRMDLEGGYTTLSHLSFDTSNTVYPGQRSGTRCNAVSEGFVIAAPSDTLEYDDIYQSVQRLRGNLIGIGWWGNTDNTTIRYSKLHDAGQCEAYDHLVYLAHGDNVRVYGNWMWNDPHGWGVQLYPAPTNARVWGNVIDGAGSGFVVGNDHDRTTSGNRIWNNVVMNSTGLTNAGLTGVAISSSWGGAAGAGNVFFHNDSFSNPGGVGQPSAVTTTGDSTADPRFVDAANHDYSLQPGSPLAGWGLWNGTA